MMKWILPFIQMVTSFYLIHFPSIFLGLIKSQLKKKIINYSVTYGQKPDLSDGYTIETNVESASLINTYLGINYYRITVNFSDGSKDQTNIRSFNVDETCPRNIAIEGMTNCRDLGGRVLEDGGKMKQGLIFRTSGSRYDYHTTPSYEGITEMLQHLKFKTEVNVSDSVKYNLNLPGTTVKNISMDYGGNASHHFSRNSESLKNFFNLLADNKNYPIFYHCRIGTDRAGLCTILLYGLLGVPLNEIYQDYLFSNFGNIQAKRYIGIKARQDNIQNYINDINKLQGKTFKNKVYNALLSIGVSSSTLDTVIDNLTDELHTKNYDNGQIVATAEKLTGNGVTVTKDISERDHPNYYYTLDCISKSVSYSFTSSLSKLYRGQIVAYLGNTDHSTDKKIGDAISCKFDSHPLKIKDQTYAEAGMGNCKGRMNYNPVILGEIDISPGKHTITISGTNNNNTMNIGTLCIFNVEDSPSDVDLAQSDQDKKHFDHVHQYQAQGPITNKYNKTLITYLCDCSAKYISIDFLNGYSSLKGSLSYDGINGKLSNDTIVKYDIPANADLTVKLQFAVKIPNTIDKNNKMDTSKYEIKINGTPKQISIPNGSTYEDIGISTYFYYITFCTFDIDNDMNIEIEFYHNNNDDNRLLFGEEVRLVYDAL